MEGSTPINENVTRSKPGLELVSLVAPSLRHHSPPCAASGTLPRPARVLTGGSRLTRLPRDLTTQVPVATPPSEAWPCALPGSG